ncbi:MAG: nucleoside diphosphate kinase [Alyxoria varia]|nr:MAG: nucleoside diphosphate kinase [Alyxoria varia]
MTTEQTFIAVKPDGVQVTSALSDPLGSNNANMGILSVASLDPSFLVLRIVGMPAPVHRIARLGDRQDLHVIVHSYKLVAIKLLTASTEHLEKHYADLSDKPFFKGLVAYMASGPVCAMVWEGKEVVKMGRALLGATNPLQSAPGTIRGDYGIDVGRNICHGSDAVDSAKKEIALWFKPEEIQGYNLNQFSWIYEKP